MKQTNEQTLFVDESEIRDNFTQIPNLIDDLPLSVYAFRLYAHIKRRTGENPNGSCWETTRNLAKSCGMSLGAVVKTKQELQNFGLISIHKIPGGDGKFGHDKITLKNIWGKNSIWFQLSPEERKAAMAAYSRKSIACSPHEQPCSPHEQPCSRSGT